MRKKAFTLAEVLITLGIIGIVAALTIPSLIQKYKKIQYVTGLQKGYTIMSNAMKKLLTDTGCDDLKCTGVFDNPLDADKMEQMVRKYFNVVKICKSGDESCNYMWYKLHGEEFKEVGADNDTFMFVTTDGIAYFLNSILTTDKPTQDGLSKIKYSIGIDIDINYNKKPNTRGRDIHGFQIAQDGTLYPFRGKEWAKYKGNSTGYYWKDYNSAYCSMTSKNDSNGDGCIARIMENGWVMDY